MWKSKSKGAIPLDGTSTAASLVDFHTGEKLGSLAEFDLTKVLKRGTRAKSHGPGCRLILEHLSERCAANCLMGKTSNASRCSAFNDPSFS